MNARTILSYGLLILCLSGCEFLRPKPLGLKATVDGPPAFSDGWEHGCYSGMATMGNSYYKAFYRFKQDPHRTTDKLYYKGWKDGFRYCRHYVLKWTFDPIDAPDSMDPNK